MTNIMEMTNIMDGNDEHYGIDEKFEVCINIEEVNLVSFESPFFAESNDTKFTFPRSMYT